MDKANVEIRKAMRKAKVPAWAIGDKIGVHENTVIRRLRHELPDSDKQELLKIITSLERSDTPSSCYSVMSNSPIMKGAIEHEYSHGNHPGNG